MTILTNLIGKQPACHRATAPLHLVRRFIATGEARFPLACIWTLVCDSNIAAEAPSSSEPSLAWLAVGVDLLRRALHPTLTFAC